MKKKELQNNDKVDNTMSGGSKPEENEKKVGFFRRVWNWIKKILGL